MGVRKWYVHNHIKLNSDILIVYRCIIFTDNRLIMMTRNESEANFNQVQKGEGGISHKKYILN